MLCRSGPRSRSPKGAKISEKPRADAPDTADRAEIRVSAGRDEGVWYGYCDPTTELESLPLTIHSKKITSLIDGTHSPS